MSLLVAAPVLPALIHLLAHLPVRPAPAASLLLPLLLQEFSADMNSRPVKRVEDVSRLRAAQFSEDNGALGWLPRLLRIVAAAVAARAALVFLHVLIAGCLSPTCMQQTPPLARPMCPPDVSCCPVLLNACLSMCLRHYDFLFLEIIEISI